VATRREAPELVEEDTGDGTEFARPPVFADEFSKPTGPREFAEFLGAPSVVVTPRESEEEA
jgi:hypothetical protein